MSSEVALVGQGGRLSYVDMRFEFATTNRILFGLGTLREVAPAAKEMGRRALVITGRSPDRAQPLLESLIKAGLAHAVFSIAGEPTTDSVVAGVETARCEECDLVIAFGGGSAIDGAKAIAAMLANPGELLDYLEVVGRGKPIARSSVPWIAIPTTAGTGAEVTRNAVLASPAHKVKASLRSPLMLPRLAIIDPELTLHLPPAITASTGLDALTQLIEPYVCVRTNPLTDALCVEGMKRAARSLQRAFENGADAAAREDMATVSLFSGMALANAGLGAVHGFAAPIGGMFSAPHGAVCAALLPHVMEMNLRALSQRAPSSDALRRYEDVARLLTGNAQATARDGVVWARDLCKAVQIPPLRAYGITGGDFTILCEKAAAASSMKANPIALTPDELREILVRAG
jgi:alcohol dehydrogenase class IV